MSEGWVFVAEKIVDTILFTQSGFVGYKNSEIEHLVNEFKDGSETNPALTRIYGAEKENAKIFEAFKIFLNSFGIKRNFETGEQIRFFYNEEDIWEVSNCYFLSPTAAAISLLLQDS